MKFSEDQINSFREASYDFNPLHAIRTYAERTPFGQIVVFGMASVLMGLSLWAKKRSFRLVTMKCQFKRPLFLNTEYDYVITESGFDVTIQILKGSQLQSKLQFSWADTWSDIGAIEGSRNKTSFKPLAAAKSSEALSKHFDRYDYQPNAAAMKDLERAFDFTANQLSANQLNALLWASYFVGMEHPGQKALFSSFHFEFSKDKIEASSFFLKDIQIEFDPRFNSSTIRGSGAGVESFEIQAFHRPSPIDYSFSEIQRTLGAPSEIMKGKMVLVSGAARGFGSVIAKAYAAMGAKLVLLCREDNLQARSTFQEIKDQGGEVRIFFGDLAESETCAEIAQSLATANIKLDLLVLNATPAIRSTFFLEQTPSEFSSFVSTSIALHSNVCHYMLPLLRGNGIVVNTSSLFTVQPQKEFTHYISAKMAVEGLMRGLAKEFPQQQFISFRLPAMLTDQTNLPFHSQTLRSPVELVKSIMDEVQRLDTKKNLHEIDLL